jgi:putative addiction module component (TIGR02574 family)
MGRRLPPHLPGLHARWYARSMMRSADEVLKDALALPVANRAAIAGSLIESLDDGTVDEDAEAQWSVEIARRIAEADAGKVQPVPWSEVRHRLGV